VRWRPDGQLDFLGRIDDEAKVRGFRITPGEIVAALRDLPAVTDATVMVRGDRAEDKEVVAFVVVLPPAQTTPEQIRAELETTLPRYAIPSEIVLRESLPLTPSGKVDRRALWEAWRRTERNDRGVVPMTDVERTITEVWCEALHRESIGRLANVFEAGAHSLAALQVHAILQKRLAPDLVITDLFRYPTVASLAQRIVTPAITERDTGEPRGATQAAQAAVVTRGRRAAQLRAAASRGAR
jgi:hypothetical protein